MNKKLPPWNGFKPSKKRPYAAFAIIGVLSVAVAGLGFQTYQAEKQLDLAKAENKGLIELKQVAEENNKLANEIKTLEADNRRIEDRRYKVQKMLNRANKEKIALQAENDRLLGNSRQAKVMLNELQKMMDK